MTESTAKKPLLEDQGCQGGGEPVVINVCCDDKPTEPILERVPHFTNEQCQRCGEFSEHRCPNCHEWIENKYIAAIDRLRTENEELKEKLKKLTPST